MFNAQVDLPSSITLVVPLYNEGEQVMHLLTHITELVGFDEVILVDASDDEDSTRLLEHWISKVTSRTDQPKSIRVVRSDIPSRARQMNIGARESTHDAVLFLHCDTTLPRDGAVLVAEQLKKGAEWGRFDVKLDEEGVVFRVIESMINLRSRCRRLATGDQGIFVNKAVFSRLGGYPEIALMEDIAISKLFGARSKPALIHQCVTTSARRWSKQGTFRTVLLMWKLRFLFWLGYSPARLASMYRHVR